MLRRASNSAATKAVPCIVVAPEDVIFAVPRAVRLDVAAGTRVSLFPMARVSGWSRGLEWPLDGLVLDPMARIGTSNRATGPVTLEFDAPGVLAVLPRARLDAAIEALGG